MTTSGENELPFNLHNNHMSQLDQLLLKRNFPPTDATVGQQQVNSNVNQMQVTASN